MHRRAARLAWALAFLVSLLLCNVGQAASGKKRTRPTSASKAPGKGSAFDKEYARRKTSCSRPELMQNCITREVDTENCVMRCISQSCYNKIFLEPLEEGEVAFEKTNRFKRCARDELKAAYKRGETF